MSASPSSGSGRDPVGEAVGEAVGDLYAEHPYPDHGVVSDVVARMAAGTIASASSSGPGRLLDAGCGTGEQTLGLARANPGWEVVGIDFNEASLRRARELAAEHGIDVRFERHDLLEPLEGIADVDVVVSVGVLHHLAEPAVALRNLRAVTRAGGALLGMVYGSFGKHDLFLERDAIRLAAGEGASREGQLDAAAALRQPLTTRVARALASVEQRLRYGPTIRIAEAVRRVAAGRNRAFAADTYTHAHELTFTWASLAELLGETGWEWTGWPPRSGMPDSPDALFGPDVAASVAARPLAEQAAILERIVRPPHLYFLATRP